MKILVAGATGFVGTNLIKELIKEGHEVTALCRSLNRVTISDPLVKWVEGDLLFKDSLPVIDKVEKAFYLVHGLGGSEKNFEYEESLAAVNFINWVRSSKPEIIYLGALGKDSGLSSPHLRSRHLTGGILGASGLGVLEFRASIILGSGSLSFEMIKGIASRAPFIPVFSLLSEPCEPLSLPNLLSYLKDSLNIKIKGHRIVEIGAGEQTTYGELLEMYLRVNNEKKIKKTIPDIEPVIVKQVLEYLVPEHAGEGKKLVESLNYPTVANPSEANKLFPNIVLTPLEEAMREASLESHTHYSPLWDKDFIKDLLADKVLKQGLKTAMDIREFFGKHL